jgi:enamine deaminase RidA (YjgF/YER057c/UK114 family)
VATLDLALPTLASASGPVRPFRSHGTTTFLSGNVAMRDGALVATGKLGADIDVATGQLCARQCALNLLSRMREVAGSLDEVDRILKLTVFVASTPLFVDQHIVADGASDLFVEVFGHLGEHARSAIGVAALPLDSPVEVEAVIAIRASSDGSDAPRGA